MNIKLPKRDPKPDLFYATMSIYNHPDFRDVVPEEATISYPVPDLSEGIPMLRLFHYWEQSHPIRSVTRPLTYITAQVTDTFKTADLLRYEVASKESPLFPTVPDPSEVPPEPLSSHDKRQLQNVVYVTCKQLLRQEFEVDEEVFQAYGSALQRLSWPGLLPFYHKLNPEFAKRANF
jgi:hypothetical protein